MLINSWRNRTCGTFFGPCSCCFLLLSSCFFFPAHFAWNDCFLSAWRQHMQSFHLWWCLSPVLAFSRRCRLLPRYISQHCYRVSPLRVFLKAFIHSEKLKRCADSSAECLWNMLINQLVATEVYHIVKYNKFNNISGVENWAASQPLNQNHSHKAFYHLLYTMYNYWVRKWQVMMKGSKLEVAVTVVCKWKMLYSCKSNSKLSILTVISLKLCP